MYKYLFILFFYISVSDFTSQLSQMYEQQAAELQNLVASYRKKNSELRKERYFIQHEFMYSLLLILFSSPTGNILTFTFYKLHKCAIESLNLLL